MELYRSVENQLIAWKKRKDHLPLILEGARQVGKTWVMKNFGAHYYKKTAYFNFEDNPSLIEEFQRTKDPTRLIGILSLYCGFEIIPGEALIIFDEIQECKNALNSLKYFSEDAPQYDILSASSLLRVAMNQGGTFPVGKVEFIRMYPLTFREFLMSTDRSVCDYMDKITKPEPLPMIIIDKLYEQFRKYLICGGMPKAVLTMLEGGELAEVDRVLKDILHSYALDFSKHAPKTDIPRISEIWKSIPSQLAKENRKFIYKLVRPGARAREYENALLWLIQAGLIYKVNCCNKPALPLRAYDDVSSFKVYLFDIGILRVLSDIPPSTFIEDNSLFQEFKGAFYENVVLQSLKAQLAVDPRYWVSTGRAEVDFVIQINDSIFPLEVKASDNTAGKSLSVYIRNYAPKLGLIAYKGDFVKRDGVLHIPNCVIDWLKQVL